MDGLRFDLPRHISQEQQHILPTHSFLNDANAPQSDHPLPPNRPEPFDIGSMLRYRRGLELAYSRIQPWQATDLIRHILLHGATRIPFVDLEKNEATLFLSRTLKMLQRLDASAPDGRHQMTPIVLPLCSDLLRWS
jgi:hypothetical protein